MPDGWGGEAVTIRWTSSTPLLRKMLMASRLPTRRGPTASQKNRLPGPQWSPHSASSIENKRTSGLPKQGSVGRPTDAPWNAVSAFANCGRAVAHVRGSYVPIVLKKSFFFR
jgi:hypothetical protein